MNTTAGLWINSFVTTVQKSKSKKPVPVAQNNMNIIIYHQLMHSHSTCVAQSRNECVQNFMANFCICYSLADQHRNERFLKIFIPFSQLWYRFFSEIFTDRVEESEASSCPEDWGSSLLPNGGLSTQNVKHSINQNINNRYFCFHEDLESPT
jgi:hypothetical protein